MIDNLLRIALNTKNGLLISDCFYPGEGFEKHAYAALSDQFQKYRLYDEKNSEGVEIEDIKLTKFIRICIFQL